MQFGIIRFYFRRLPNRTCCLNPWLVLLGLLLFMRPSVGTAIDLPTVAGGTMAMNLALQEAYSGTNGFSADVNVAFTNPDGSRRSWPLSVSKSGTFMMSQFRLSDFGTSPERDKEAMRRFGIDQITVVMNTQSNRVLVIVPGISSYVNFVAPSSLSESLQNIRKGEVSWKFLAEDLVGDVACQKYQISKPGDVELGLAWLRPDLNNFPVKIEIQRRTEITTITVSRLELSNPLPSVFEVPPGFLGYTTFDSAITNTMRLRREAQQRGQEITRPSNR